jgi:hypothetical protein
MTLSFSVSRFRIFAFTPFSFGGYYMNIYFEADLSEFIQGDAFGFSMVLHPEVPFNGS